MEVAELGRPQSCQLRPSPPQVKAGDYRFPIRSWSGWIGVGLYVDLQTAADSKNLGAHVLLFLKSEDEARGLYLQHRGKKLAPDQTSEDFILRDFQLLRQAGHTSPFMDEIEEMLRAALSNSPHRILVR